jgi:hypothetical protein
MLPFAFEFFFVVLYERDLRFHAANVSASQKTLTVMMRAVPFEASSHLMAVSSFSPDVEVLLMLAM